MNKSLATASPRHLRKMALGSTALSLMLLAAASAAMAAPIAAPASGSLPGSFTTNTAGTTYVGTGSTGTITIGTTGAAAQVLQYGGTPLGNSVAAPVGITANAGFSIGAGASLTLTGGGSLPTLVNDETGSPSQVYGSLDASGLGGALFVANASGVVVGDTGTIDAPSAGLGLVGYAVDSTAAATAGSITVNDSTIGAGTVTVATPTSLAGGIYGGPLLIAGNGTINVGAVSTYYPGTAVLAGYGFTASAASGGSLTVGAALSTATNSVVNFSGGTQSNDMSVPYLSAAGAVNNTGHLNLSNQETILGTFTNNGTANVNDLSAGAIYNAGVLNNSGDTLTAKGAPGATSGADITNTGVINQTSSSDFSAYAGSDTGASGNFSNTGIINFTLPTSSGDNYFYVDAANINFAGSIQQDTGSGLAALSATNYLSDFYLYSGYDQSSPTSNYTGVVDYASTIYSYFSEIDAGAARILSGGLYGAGTDNYTYFYLGNGQLADPFTNTTLNYNLSLFPGTTVQAGYIGVYGTSTTQNALGSNINLDGVLSTQTPASGFQYNSISVSDVNNIHGVGGFALANNGVLEVEGFSGNLNNPYGAATAGSTAFQYNYVPVNVGATLTGATGTATIDLSGPTTTSGTAQMINLLVNGNVVLGGDDYGNAPSLPITPTVPTSYTNNHLVVQATGNIQVAGYSEGNTFYWPGMVYLSTINSAANPLALNLINSITLSGNLNNVIPAAVPATDNAGISFQTNNLNLGGYSVTTNMNSGVTFATAAMASAFAAQYPTFFNQTYLDVVTPTVTDLAVQQMPLAAFLPAS